MILFIEYPPCSTCQKAKAWLTEQSIAFEELQLKEKLPAMSEDEQYALLATDGMLVKRPILVTDETVIPGFRAAEWEAALK